MGSPTRWSQLETNRLLRAWKTVVPAPRARDPTPTELQRVFRHFRELVGSERCATVTAVLRMIRQMVATYQFISTFDGQSRRLGNNKSWFELSLSDRAKCTVGLPTDSLVMKFVSQDFFRAIARICSDGPSAASTPSAGQSGAVEEEQLVHSGQQGSTSDWEPGIDTEASQAGNALRVPDRTQAPARSRGKNAGIMTADGSGSAQVETPPVHLVSSSGSVQSQQSNEAGDISVDADDPGSPSDSGAEAQRDDGYNGPGGSDGVRSGGSDSATATERNDDSDITYEGITIDTTTDATSRNDASELGDGDDTTSETGSPLSGPFGDWSKRDLLRFLQAWKEAVDAFLVYGNVAHESVKLPSWLIRQHWMRHGGSSELTVGSITDMKRLVIVGFQAVCDNLAQLLDDGEDADASSNWFLLSFSQRSQMLSKPRIPKDAQHFACKLDEDVFNQIAAILNKEAVLSSVTPPTQRNGQIDDDDSYLSPSIEAEFNNRKQQSVVVSRRSSSPPRQEPSSRSSIPDPDPSSHVEGEAAPSIQLLERPAVVDQRQVTRKRPLSPESTDCDREGGSRRGADGSYLAIATRGDANDYREPERPRQLVWIQPRADDARQDGEQRIHALLDCTQRDFDQFMSSMRAERLRERQQRQKNLFQVVAQRCNPPMDLAREAYLRELALQQSRQLLDNFMALHSERGREREQQHRLLLDAVRGRFHNRCHPLDHLQPQENAKLPETFEHPLRR